MGETTGIAWCHHTFNPWEGCTKVSAGCDRCYAENRNLRFHAGSNWGEGAPRLLRSENNWRQPFLWNKAAGVAGERRRVFCASLADVFDNEAPVGQRERLWGVIAECRNLDWLLLTKRPENIGKFLPRSLPRDNIWLGATVENQDTRWRVDELLMHEAAIRFLSCEPLLGPIDLMMNPGHMPDWVIAGGESGRGARPCDLDWLRSLRDQCRVAGAWFFLKQLGGYPDKFAHDRAILDGRTWTEVPTK